MKAATIRVRLRRPESVPAIGDTVGEVVGRTALGRVRVLFRIRHFDRDRETLCVFRDEELEVVDEQVSRG